MSPHSNTLLTKILTAHKKIPLIIAAIYPLQETDHKTNQKMRPDVALIFQYFKKKLNCFSNQLNLKQCLNEQYGVEQLSEQLSSSRTKNQQRIES